MCKSIENSRPTSDQRRGRLPRSSIGLLLALTAFACIGAFRLRWLARPRSEEFPSSIRTLEQAALGLFADLRTPAQADPDVQLEFWTTEIDRILKMHPDDAELHAAAAVMLAQPSLLYLSQAASDVVKEDSSDPFPVSFRVLGRAGDLRTRFDREGAEKSLKLIRRATELDPKDPRWWRLYAVLLWPPPLSSRQYQPLVADWERVLQTAKQHDPGNALYSLLIASRWSDKAVEYDEHAAFTRKNHKAWQKTTEHSKSCVTSLHLSLGEPAMNGIVRLHALSRHPTATTTESIRARFVASRAALSSAILTRNLISMADASDITTIQDERVELLALAQQINDLARDRSDAATRYENFTVFLRAVVLRARQELEVEFGEDSGKTQSQLVEAVRSEAAFDEASRAFQQQGVSFYGVLAALVGAVAVSLFVFLLLLALASTAAWLALSGRYDSLRLSVWPFALFGIGFVLSLFFFGIGPAGLVSEAVQHWSLTAVTFVYLLLLLGTLVRRLRLRLRFSLRSLLIGYVIVAVLLQMALSFGLRWTDLCPPIHMHASADPLLAFAQQQSPRSLERWLPAPAWTTLQWLASHGPVWAVAIFAAWSGIALAWHNNFSYSAGQMAIATALLSMLSFNVWVWLEPANYASARPRQMRYESYIRSVDQYYEPFERLLKDAMQKM